MIEKQREGNESKNMQKPFQKPVQGTQLGYA